jgi:hypothetical protein
MSSGTVALLSSNEHDVLFLSGMSGELNERQSEDHRELEQGDAK